eukprot:352652-Chlamydomonas_euryale.AAC.6
MPLQMALWRYVLARLGSIPDTKVQIYTPWSLAAVIIVTRLRRQVQTCKRLPSRGAIMLKLGWSYHCFAVPLGGLLRPCDKLASEDRVPYSHEELGFTFGEWASPTRIRWGAAGRAHSASGG